MKRRVLVDRVRLGEVELSAEVAHHVRDVLRLEEGGFIHAFDAAGSSGTARILMVNATGVRIAITEMETPGPVNGHVVVAAAIPKGSRADWMVEKLSEVGTDVFVPLSTSRGVVKPEGEGKIRRWERIAQESARQCERRGVMRIERMMTPAEFIDHARDEGLSLWLMSTAGDAQPIAQCMENLPPSVALLIGPEGDWTADEIQQFEAAGAVSLKLTRSILRVETAAMLAAGIVGAVLANGAARKSLSTRDR